MELTTPPNPTCFNRKPTRKFKKPTCGCKHSGKKKADISHSQFTYDFITWCSVCRLLLCVETIIGPMFFDKPTTAKSKPAK